MSISPERIADIERELDNTEWYSPTIPLGWPVYHEIIRELITEIRRLEQVHGHGDGI